MADPVMERIRKAFMDSKKTYKSVGIGMKYPEKNARQQAWKFINKTSAPHLAMVRKFAIAIGMPFEDLISE